MFLRMAGKSILISKVPLNTFLLPPQSYTIHHRPTHTLIHIHCFLMQLKRHKTTTNNKKHINARDIRPEVKNEFYSRLLASSNQST